MCLSNLNQAHREWPLPVLAEAKQLYSDIEAYNGFASSFFGAGVFVVLSSSLAKRYLELVLVPYCFIRRS